MVNYIGPFMVISPLLKGGAPMKGPMEFLVSAIRPYSIWGVRAKISSTLHTVCRHSSRGTIFLYGGDALVWLFVQWWTNLTHPRIDELRVVSTTVWMVGAHNISHTNRVRSKKCASFLQSMLVFPRSIVWPVWMLSHCLVVCPMVYWPHLCTQ